MSSNTLAIRVQNISKYFEIYEKPSHRLWQMLCHGRKQFYRPYWALRDISFDVCRGDCVGIIGRNGAGKSTLLQIITGTLAPSSGSVDINGRVAALLELGSGFNPEFTGKENVYLNAAILGLTDEEINARYDDIVAFAEIGEFIDQPIKSYSSGMVVRLAFAVIAHVDAEVLIIDEALAVGDAFFTQKCMRFLRAFMEHNTVLFVSHDTSAVNSLCNKALLLEDGLVKLEDTPKKVTEMYLKDMFESMQGMSATPKENTPHSEEINHNLLTLTDTDFHDMRKNMFNNSTLRNDIKVFRFDPAAESFGKKGITVEQVLLTDSTNTPLHWIVGGETVILKIQCVTHSQIFSPIVGFFVKDRLGQNLFGDNTYLVYQDQPLLLEANTAFVAEFQFVMPILEVGDYSLTVAAAEGTQQQHTHHDWKHDALMFTSTTTSISTGKMGIPMQNIKIYTASGR